MKGEITFLRLRRASGSVFCLYSQNKNANNNLTNKHRQTLERHLIPSWHLLIPLGSSQMCGL